MIVISLGGSVVFDTLDSKKIREYAEVFSDVDDKVFIVVGGGKIARDYIRCMRELNADETSCDYIGIEVTRLNAMLFSYAIKKAPKLIPKDFREAYELIKTHDIVVMGGTFPGHTTDATSAMLAEYVNAKTLFIATSVDGVYSDDPMVNPKAVKYEKLTPGELVEIVSKSKAKAGISSVVDILAAKIIERSSIRTIVFKGSVENIKKVLKGEKIGTLIER